MHIRKGKEGGRDFYLSGKGGLDEGPRPKESGRTYAVKSREKMRGGPQEKKRLPSKPATTRGRLFRLTVHPGNYPERRGGEKLTKRRKKYLYLPQFKEREVRGKKSRPRQGPKGKPLNNDPKGKGSLSKKRVRKTNKTLQEEGRGRGKSTV